LWGEGVEAQGYAKSPTSPVVAGTYCSMSYLLLTLVRYEDLVADPGSELRRILDAIDEQATVPEEGMVTFRDDHTVAGNPIRFKRGDTELPLTTNGARPWLCPASSR
jgi:hypothetical protein